MSKSMVITLGHNSSAIVVDEGKILGGYEEERFSKIKSDSSFPYQSINRLMNQFGRTYDDTCIGHWFTNGSLSDNKYIDLDLIKGFTQGDINSISDELTHHDTHLLSAKVFADSHNFGKSYLAVVADGFGTYGECITIYNVDTFGHRICTRYFGYDKSLGLLYQYATAYLEMKMLNHEYKLLGYEAHIHEVLSPEKIEFFDELILKHAKKRLNDLFNLVIYRDTDPVVSKFALAAAQNGIYTLLDEVIDALEVAPISLHDKRIVIAYYVQSIVEAVMTTIISTHAPKKLLVSGGLFYNVKLNHRLADIVESFCVMPLAGDQGAGLGVYQAFHGDLQWPGHLAWGHRDLSKVVSGDGIVVIDSEDAAFEIMCKELDFKRMVNIVRGSMEFGPRALCNTSTIALPVLPVVRRLNAMNDRTTIMPMAPCMTPSQAAEILSDTDKVVGSLNYMVVTRNIRLGFEQSIDGASHHYELLDASTCRPQIVHKDKLMTKLLDRYGPLINTSFNYHGVPIAFESDTIEYSHSKQRKFEKITTVVILEKESK